MQKIQNVQEGKRHQNKETHSCFCLCSFRVGGEVSNSWILNDIGRNLFLGSRRKIAKCLMMTNYLPLYLPPCCAPMLLAPTCKLLLLIIAPPLSLSPCMLLAPLLLLCNPAVTCLLDVCDASAFTFAPAVPWVPVPAIARAPAIAWALAVAGSPGVICGPNGTWAPHCY